MLKYKVNFDLNNFLQDIKLKKQYIKILNNKIDKIKAIRYQNYKELSSNLLSQAIFYNNNSNSFLVMYILNISFSKTNTFFHIMDFEGNVKFFYSAGSFGYKGKTKKARMSIFKNFYRFLITKLKFLETPPIAVHFKNVGSNKSWIIKKLKKKFFIQVIQTMNLFSHNGCRKSKIRRKKLKTKKEEMAEWLKAADCKSVEFSHRRFKSYSLHF